MTALCAQSEHRTKPMFIQVGAGLYPISSFAQASQMFCIARDKVGTGVSDTPTPLIVGGDGEVIGHISYNGRVWPGSTWTAAAKPLYENGAAR